MNINYVSLALSWLAGIFLAKATKDMWLSFALVAALQSIVFAIENKKKD